MMTDYRNSIHNRIFRQQLKITDYQEITINAGSRLLSVAPARGRYTKEAIWGEIQIQGIDLWYINRPEIDPNFKQQTEDVGIYLVGTGNLMPNVIGSIHTSFLGTCVMANDLVWHVFSGRPSAEKDVE